MTVRQFSHGLFQLFLCGSAAYAILEILMAFGAGRYFAGVVAGLMFGVVATYLSDRR